MNARRQWLVNTKLKTAAQADDLELSYISIQIGVTSIVSKTVPMAGMLMVGMAARHWSSVDNPLPGIMMRLRLFCDVLATFVYRKVALESTVIN